MTRPRTCGTPQQPDIENVHQRRARVARRLNGRQRVRLASSLAACLPTGRQPGWTACLNILLGDAVSSGIPGGAKRFFRNLLELRGTVEDLLYRQVHFGDPAEAAAEPAASESVEPHLVR